jgi:hypothetical protein
VPAKIEACRAVVSPQGIRHRGQHLRAEARSVDEEKVVARAPEVVHGKIGSIARVHSQPPRLLK